MHQGGGQAGKVGNVVEEKLRSLVHLFVVAPLPDLDDLGVVWTGDELLEIGKAVGLGKSKDKLCLDEGLTGLLASHLEIANQVFIVT